jgi:dihydroorotate dehydrogenase (fumarate)
MDLSTQYLGLTLKCPLVASASPLTAEAANIRRLAELGAGAVVMPSIFEEQIAQEQRLIESMDALGADSYPEALTYFPPPAVYRIGPDRYLKELREAAASVDIPVIASLNGTTDSGWIDYARRIEHAGAAAIELNIYAIATDPDISGQEVEDRYVEVVSAVRSAVTIPLAVKLSPYFSSMAHMAKRLVDAGANGLVLFNRFYQPDIDLVQLRISHSLELSSAREIRLPLLWIAVLSGRIDASLAASTGVESADEAIKYLLAGADVVMTTSALLKHGIENFKTMLDGLKSWILSRNLDSIAQVRGKLSQRYVADPEAFARANYIRVLQGYGIPS